MERGGRERKGRESQREKVREDKSEHHTLLY